MDQNLVVRIENWAAKFLNHFREEMEQCPDEFAYYDLVASVFLFKNLVLNQLNDLLKKDLVSSEEIESIVAMISITSEKISDNVISRINKNAVSANLAN